MAKIFLMQPVVLFPWSIDLRQPFLSSDPKKWIANAHANLMAVRKYRRDALDGQLAK